MEVYESIRTKVVEYPEDCDPLLIDLLNGLLEKDPEKRLSLQKAFEHKWFQE